MHIKNHRKKGFVKTRGATEWRNIDRAYIKEPIFQEIADKKCR